MMMHIYTYIDTYEENYTIGLFSLTNRKTFTTVRL